MNSSNENIKTSQSNNYSQKDMYNKYASTYSEKSNMSANINNRAKSPQTNYHGSNSNNNSSGNSSNMDFSSLTSLFNSFQSNSNNSSEASNDSSDSLPNLDMETIMKIQNIMSKMKSANGNDDMSKLLMSLKPYLRDGKKEKVDEYIKLIKM